MIKKLTLLLILAFLIPAFIMASRMNETDGLHLYTSAGIVTSGFGLGYRTGNLEIGGNISSSALHGSILFLCTTAHPITGFFIGAAAFGGADLFIRYDLIPGTRFTLSPGISCGVTYCLVGAFDIGFTAGASLHAAVGIDDAMTIFAEAGLPLYAFEYTSSCAPDGTDTASTYSGFAFSGNKTAAMLNLLMTARLGVEIEF
ncbi:MAG: hypothetical protein ACI4NM_11560 [Bullifex sp.]